MCLSGDLSVKVVMLSGTVISMVLVSIIEVSLDIVSAVNSMCLTCDDGADVNTTATLDQMASGDSRAPAVRKAKWHLGEQVYQPVTTTL